MPWRKAAAQARPARGPPGRGGGKGISIEAGLTSFGRNLHQWPGIVGSYLLEVDSRTFGKHRHRRPRSMSSSHRPASAESSRWPGEAEAQVAGARLLPPRQRQESEHPIAAGFGAGCALHLRGFRSSSPDWLPRHPAAWNPHRDLYLQACLQRPQKPQPCIPTGIRPWRQFRCNADSGSHLPAAFAAAQSPAPANSPKPPYRPRPHSAALPSRSASAGSAAAVSSTRKAFGSTANTSPAFTTENSRSRTSMSANLKTKDLPAIITPSCGFRNKSITSRN